MPVSGKLPETILPLAESLLVNSTVPGTLLLVGDGATSNTVTAFQNFFSTQPAQLIVWGIGKSGQSDESVDISASVVIPMQLEQLKALSNETNGRLVLMSNDNSDVKRVNTYIKHNMVILDDNATPWHDSGYPFVFIVAFIFLFWFRKGWTLQW